MTVTPRVALSLALVLAPAALGRAQDAPETSRVRAALCASMEIAPADCAGVTFERVGRLSLRPDREGWVYVLTDGGPDLCHVRHACFAVVARRGRRWTVALSSMGQTVAAVPRRGTADLIVTASSSSEEYVAIRYRSDDGRYRAVERATCRHDATPPRGHVCDAYEASIPLQ